MVTAPICNISRLRPSVDGDGLRTLIVFKGCPLSCKYCINPHTWNGMDKAKRFTPKRLIEAVSVDDLYFRATGGGITFGGGEPLLQAAFIKEFAEESDYRWHINVETSLNVEGKKLKLIEDIVDYFYVDIKSWNPATYKEYTGKDDSYMRQNLEYLINKYPEKLEIRIPLIEV